MGAQQELLALLRAGETLTGRQQLALILQLSLPAIFAQLSSVAMQYIDASMVGRLGAVEAASIGLVTSATWLVGGLCSAAVAGFMVQVAQRIGAGQDRQARAVMKQGYAVALAFAALVAVAGALLSAGLPRWLGGGAELWPGASAYFLIYSLGLPAMQLNNLSGSMLQASGNMRLPSMLHILMCGLDVVFNALLIYPTRRVAGITLPGAGLGVAGAALGTALAQLTVALLMTWCLMRRSPALRLRPAEPLQFTRECLSKSVKISIPVAMEQCVLSGAQVLSTAIVAPLGTVAIAANSFAITAESLCYMPSYGIASAAVTLTGQSIGAGQQKLTRRLGYLSTGLGMLLLAAAGTLMWLGAPWLMTTLSSEPQVIELGAAMLRIAAFSEPMYAASIVAAGVFRGAGDTLVPSCFNFGCMWLIRLPLAALLTPRIGLRGVWTAMCIELCVRGALYLSRLFGGRWLHGAVQRQGTPAPEAAQDAQPPKTE